MFVRQSALVIIFLLGLIFNPSDIYAQIDFNKKPDDDLGNVEDKFQELFFEALKQKGIENYQRAIDALLKCEELNNEEAVIYLELGKNYSQLEQFNLAEEALLKGLKITPQNEWLLDQLYEVYTQQNNIPKAIETVKKLVEVHPDYKQDLATLYIRQKQFDDALKLLDELDKNLGSSPVRNNMRNEIYKQTAGDDSQITDLQHRIKSNPKNESNYLALIYSYQQNGNQEKAFETAQNLLKEIPESELVHVALYEFYLQNNQAEGAFKSAEKALISAEVNNNDKTKILQNLVNFAGNNAQYEKKLIALTSLISSDQSSESLSEVASYYLQSGDKQKALESYQKALQQNPTDFTLIKNSLLLQLDLQLYDNAAKESEQAISLFPAQPLLYLLNGVAQNNLKNPDKAIENLEMGLDFLIDDKKMEADFYQQLSISYQLKDNITKSKTFAEKAAAIIKAQ